MARKHTTRVKRIGQVLDRVARGALAASHSAYNSRRKHRALVYDILPSTTAVFSYAIGS